MIHNISHDCQAKDYFWTHAILSLLLVPEIKQCLRLKYLAESATLLTCLSQFSRIIFCELPEKHQTIPAAIKYVYGRDSIMLCEVDSALV